MGNSKTGGSDDITAKGKYLLISVPDFGDDPINPGKKMTSYLRMGAASSTWKEDPGGSLAAQVHLAGPAGNHLSPAGQEVDVTGVSGDARPVFIDDTRERGAGEQTYLSVGEREMQSSHLHTRGGWRDHSDGNRISTTYGDKVEVIRGNYKMVVLGRNDDWSNAAGWDASGQHIQDFARTWSAFLRVEWTQQYDGVWHNQTTTDGVVPSENFGGDSYEFKWGNHFESTIGSESPAAPEVKPPRGNPHIIDKTWATQIESYTGSAAWRIPLIKEETWATDTISLTDAASTSETTRVSGSITSDTTAGSISETTSAGSISGTTSAGTITDVTTVGAMAGVTVAGTITDVTTVGAMTELTVAAGAMAGVTVARAIGNLTLAGVHVDIEGCVGKLDVFLGGHVSVALPDRLQFSFPDSTGQKIKELETAITRTNIAMEDMRIALSHRISAIRIELGGG
jgi:hypothetical protein